MRILVSLPKVEPDRYLWPQECPYADCGGRAFKPHGIKGERKPLRDPHYDHVIAYRRKCLKCGQTFRVYPRGVTADQQSDRLKGISALLYVLGLSYGGVEDFLSAMNMPLGKTTVYTNVQAAGVSARRQQSQVLLQGGKRAVIGSDATYVKVKGAEVGIQVVVDDRSGELLGLAIVVSENTEEVLALVRAVAEQVQAEVLVSDDLDTYKRVADELELEHQLCINHVKRNVDDLAEELQKQLRLGEPVPEGVDSSPERLVEDLGVLQQLVRSRPAEGEVRLEEFYGRYQAAPQPKAGQHHSVWLRMRMLLLRLWDRWMRLTLDQRRGDLDGTNNQAERVIGWWIKERYRTMRGYKRTESILNVATLTAHMGVRSGAYDMSVLYA